MKNGKVKKKYLKHYKKISSAFLPAMLNFEQNISRSPFKII